MSSNDEQAKLILDELERNLEIERVSFEERVWRHYFAHKVTHYDKPEQWVVIFKRDKNGLDYEDVTISAIWFGWRMRMSYATPIEGTNPGQPNG